MTDRRALAGMAALAICALPLAPARAQVLEIATDQSPVGLDPHIATAFSTAMINSVIYEGLTAIDRDLRTVPGLAESWTVSADGLTYDFKLRPGATFHNGRAVTPADVIASIARVRDPKTASPLASRFTVIKSVEPVGADGVRMVLDTPSAPLLAQLAVLAIVAPEASAELARKPVGTGPFRFQAWVPDTYIALERSPGFWAKGLPILGGLKFNIVPEAATRQLGLAGGTYALLPAIDAATAAMLADKPDVQLMEVQDLAYSLIGINVSKPPFDKPAVREAFNLAIDRSELVQAAYFGRAVPGGPLSPALKEWALPNTAFPCYTPDPVAAMKKLAEAGVTGKLKLTLNVLGSVQQVVDVAQVVQAQLNKAGFDAQLNVQEAGRFIADWRASNFEAFVSLNGGGPDPDDYFGRTYQTGGATNVFKYSNPALDKLLIDARASSDQAARKRMYDEAQKILACTGPTVNLAYATVFTAVRAELKDFYPMATRSLRALREAKLAK